MFSNDVIFNENLSGCLGVPHTMTSPSPPSDPSMLSSPCLPHTAPHIHTAAGHAFDSEIQLRDSRKASRATHSHGLLPLVENMVNGGAVDVGGDVVDAPDGTSGGVCIDVLPAEVDTQSLKTLEIDVLAHHRCPSLWGDFSESDDSSLPPTAFSAPASFSFHCPFDLTKFPLSYSEAITCSNALIWQAAMDREQQSLGDMGAFEEVDLPECEQTIGLKWVYDRKTDAAGVNIPGK